MRASEVIAKELIERAIRGSMMRSIISQSAGEWDFDLIVGNSVSALEVTQSTGQRTEGLWAAIFGKDGAKSSFPRVLASGSWIVTVSHLADVRQVRLKADALLARIEAEGRNQFSVRETDDMQSPTARVLWEELRLTDGFRLEGAVGDHEIAPPHERAMLSSDQVVAAVEREAHKADNRRKLGQAATTERHLFVQLGDLSYPAREAMRACGLPTRHVSLPTEITHIWVSGHFGLGDEHRLWRFDPAHGWHDFGLIDLGIDVADA
jgi:hypothetical protein